MSIHEFVQFVPFILFPFDTFFFFFVDVSFFWVSFCCCFYYVNVEVNLCSG